MKHRLRDWLRKWLGCDEDLMAHGKRLDDYERYIAATAISHEKLVNAMESFYRSQVNMQNEITSLRVKMMKKDNAKGKRHASQKR